MKKKRAEEKIEVISKTGRYGGTYAHEDVAL